MSQQLWAGWTYDGDAMTQVAAPGHAPLNPGHDPGSRPRLTISEACTLTGKSQSTIKRALRTGRLDEAAVADSGEWRIPVEALLATFGATRVTTSVTNPGQRPVSPVHDPGHAPAVDGLSSRLAELERDLAVERARREAAESVAVAHEQRAKNAERALLMIEAMTPRHESTAPVVIENPDEAPPPTPNDPAPQRRRWWSRRT